MTWWTDDIRLFFEVNFSQDVDSWLLIENSPSGEKKNVAHMMKDKKSEDIMLLYDSWNWKG